MAKVKIKVTTEVTTTVTTHGKIKRNRVLEKAIETAYGEKYSALTGISAALSKKFIKTLMTQVIKESLAEGTYALGPDYGRKFLELAATDENAAREL
jgi:hypothetical protein